MSAAGADPALTGRLHAALHKLDKTGAIVSARVIDLGTGHELFAERIDEPFTPASNMKLPVSAAALDRFGPDHQLKTYLALDGDDLWLIGTGDPSVGDGKLTAGRKEKPTTVLDQWADALKSRGVTRVKGNLYFYDGAFEDLRVHPTWSRGYLTDWYAAPVSGLNFNDNCVDVTLRPAAGAAAGQPAQFDLTPPADKVVKVVNQATTGPGREPTIDRDAKADVFTVKGSVAGKKELESRCVTDPGLFFADALRTNLAAHGIAVDGETKRADKPLGGHLEPPADKVVATYSTPLTDVLWRINKSSQNLFAEAMCKYQGRAYAIENGQPDARGSWENGSAAVKAFLRRQGIDDSKYVILDGSGLSKGDRVTTRGHSDLLAAMFKHKYADAFRNSLAAAGKDGTIGKRMPDLAGKVFAKTGYIGGVRALSGYAQTRQGKWLAFSIIYNKIPGPVKPYEELQDEAVRALVDWQPAGSASTAPVALR